MQEKAIERIEAQQATLQRFSAPWVVGEQLKEICRSEPDAAELIYTDLQEKSMSITEAEKKIKAYADKNKVGKFAFVPPQKADEILRTFYGLPPAAKKEQPTAAQGGEEAAVIDLSAFL